MEGRDGAQGTVNKIIWKGQNQRLLEIRLERGHVDAVQKRWEQALCRVQKAMNGIINDAQV